MQSFLDPAILFFVFGILAGALRSNLEIPPPISRFLSLYLLMALGLKGGFALATSGLTADVAISLACALALAFIVPALGCLLLRRFLSGFDAAAICATYGSVSAVTFITAVQYLDNHAVAFGGHMAAAMALMESPAIVMAVVLGNMARRRAAGGGGAASAGAPDFLASIDRLHGMEALREKLTSAEARLYQVSLADINRLTGLSFPALKGAEVELAESLQTFGPRPIQDLSDVRL